jgi:chemotaxis protein MotB
VVLYTFARADQKKQLQVSQAIDTAFRSMGVFHDHPEEDALQVDVHRGGANTASSLREVMNEDLESPAKVRDDLEHIRRELTKSLSPQIADHSLSIAMGRDGLVVSLREAGFFDSGSAAPHPGTGRILKAIGASLDGTDFDVRIEGHTDNVPVHNAQFDSNWELSTARATGIARLVLQLRAIPADRISAAGFAEFHPVADNATAEGRAQNRRVDLVVIPRARINFASSGSPASNGPWRRITDN